MKELRIRVTDVAGLDRLRPVTGGVPLAQGAAPWERPRYSLRDERGAEVPLQARELARWPDGSARWVLLDFLARPPRHGASSTVLTWAEDTQGAAPAGPPAGSVGLEAAAGQALGLSGRLDVGLSLVDGDGRVCDAVFETAAEESGSVRRTATLVGAFRTEAGERVFGVRLRASVYAGLSLVRLEPLIVVDAEHGVLQRIRELTLTVTPRGGLTGARLGGDGKPCWQGEASAAVRLFAVDDQQLVLEGAEGRGEPSAWAEIDDEQGPIAVAMREMRQQWPKSLEVGPRGLAVGLFPRFERGAFGHMEPWYKHQWLFDGECYRLRTGQARRWEIWLDLEGGGAGLLRLADAPLVPAADPEQAIATGVWGDIAPAGTPAMADYDAWAQNLSDAYRRSIEVQRDTGAMNWGDWFGERRVNWGNHEYDTTNQLLVQFARTGESRYFYAAAAAARHSSEVDTVHHVNADLAAYFGEHFGRRDYPPRPGMVHQHAVGHVGSFYPIDTVRELLVEHGIGKHSGGRPYTCLDPFNLGHVWTQGLVRHYFLTGEPFVWETVLRIGDNLAQLVEDRQYKFMGHTHCGRTTGWPLLALAGAWELDHDDRYLAAMKTLVDDALELQDPVCGGWIIHPMAADHCVCKTARHTGMATFITAVLINGLARCYELTGDDRLPHAIDEAVTYINNDTWRENLRGWRYTSCPGHRTASQPGVVVMAYVHAVRITGNPEHLRILRLAWHAKFQRLLEAPPPGPGFGKTYTATMYGCPEAASLLASPDLEDNE